jgi:hypothetical protein
MVLRLQRTGIVIASLVMIGCVSYPRPYPWNFPSEEEWNAPLETSWVNLVDNWRNLTAPRNKVWNPIIREYEPDFGRDLEEHELYQ